VIVPWQNFIGKGDPFTRSRGSPPKRFARRLLLSGPEEISMPRSKSNARPRSRRAQKGRAKAARRIRQVMPYIQAAATATSAAAALIQAIKH
jgi:hypothetical protein